MSSAPRDAGGVIGVDFGTTNTVVATLDADGRAQLVRFATPTGPIEPFRSALAFHEDPDDPRRRVVQAGPWAVEAFLEEPLETRLIQSFKSHAASPLFQETTILGRRYAFEDLLSAFLLRLREHGGEALAPGLRCVIGRPVSFAGEMPDASLALERYGRAFARLEPAEVRYAYEPVAAALFFARGLDAAATVMVGDFGGGTSDFSILRFEGGAGAMRARALANAGVGVAGDAFDYRIIDHLVSPALGKGSRYRAFDNVAPIPNRYFSAFARWEQLALLRASRDMRDIRGLARTALEPAKLAALVDILDHNHGYRLYQAVSALKEALSARTSASFVFETDRLSLSTPVARTDFEAWIAPELSAIEAAVDRCLAQAQVDPGEIDKVFLTGGSSFVPAVRAIFERRFDASRIEGGSELVSIAAGLAYLGGGEDATAGSVAEMIG
ncbi:MAG TPA: Hsp70 family protein [Caulobacteraceae bacterium]|jgi:hypothetical chaperone protein|nr:Hsp70 family protein [Caulobacteraceae bacterium]